MSSYYLRLSDVAGFFTNRRETQDHVAMWQWSDKSVRQGVPKFPMQGKESP